MRRLVIPLLAAAALAVAAAPAVAAKPPPVFESGSTQPRGGSAAKAPPVSAAASLLWATVNLCAPPEAPYSMGVRASVPGNGHRQRMYVRFTAQWFNGLTGQWEAVSGARSPWLFAGSARYRFRQVGWTFEFEQPAVGTGYVMRGVADVQYRNRKVIRLRKRKSAGRKRRGRAKVRWVVAKRHSLITKGGVASVGGGESAGTSLPLCGIV